MFLPPEDQIYRSFDDKDTPLPRGILISQRSEGRLPPKLNVNG